MKKRIHIIFGALWIAWLLAMFFFLEQPADGSFRLSGSITAIIMRLLSVFQFNASTLEHFIRKLAHFCAFVASGIFGTVALRTIRPSRCFVISAAAHCLLATISELLQMFAKGRSCNLIDIVIDAAGACAGIALSVFVSRILQKCFSEEQL